MKQLVLLLIFIPVLLKAQDNPKRKKIIGLKSGIVRSDLLRSPYETTGNTGLTFGTVFLVSFSQKVSLQVELNYTRKGFKQLSIIKFPSAYGFYNPGVLYSTKNEYNYIDLPLLLNFNFISRKAIFGVQAGPGINLFMSGKTYSYLLPSGYSSTYTLTSEFINISLSGGAYFGLKLDRVKLLLSPRYSVNLLNSPFGSFRYPEVSFITGYEF